MLSFVLLDTSPGDVTETLLGDDATQQQRQVLRAQLGLDQPVVVRYVNFLRDLILHGDMGESLVTHRPVIELIGQRFFNTLLLAFFAMSLALAVGILFGGLAARQHDSWIDLTTLIITSLGLSIPAFGSAIFLTQVFSVRLGWLPAVGGGSLKHFILPCVSLALPTAAVITRLARSSILETLRLPHVTAARAKGLSAPMIWRRHVLRNSLAPVINLAGVHFGHLLGGAFIVETIFAWPGLGRLTVQAIFDRDYPVVLGAVILGALIFQLLNLLVDLLHQWLDPRLRLDQ
jgi:ABC-type dipeptide/oligopeptide/nickel transport system permease component